MDRKAKWVLAVLAVGALLLASAAQAQTTTKKTEPRDFEIISVDGQKVVVRSGGRIREVTVPADFKLTYEGKEIGLADLKPGMKGTAMVTVTSTETPVTVTEVKNAEVKAVAGTAIIVKNTDGTLKQYTIDDVRDKNATIYKDGKKVEISDLRPGDRLTATIITHQPPKVVTESQIASANVSSAPASKAAAPASAPAASAPAPAPAPAASAPAPAAAPAAAPAKAKKLPKTGSNLPALAWLGSLSVAAGALLTLRRRTRTAR